MADQSGKVSGAANPPFATKAGRPANQGAGSTGAHDFIKDPTSKTGPGPGYLLKDRPQSEAKAEVVPNPESIPAGGKVLKIDKVPSGSGSAQGGTQGVAKVPFKGLK